MKKLLIILSALLLITGCKTESTASYEPNRIDNSGNIVINNAVCKKTSEVLVMDKEVTINDESSDSCGLFLSGRTVILSPFFLGKYEVTQELYKAVVEGQTVTIDDKTYELNSEPSKATDRLRKKHKQKLRPVESITWIEAVYFCNILSEKLNLEKCYDIKNIRFHDGHITCADITFIENSNGYRLPTIHEWQFAARGADVNNPDWHSSRYGVSDSINLDMIAWHKYNQYSENGITDEYTISQSYTYKTAEVGTKLPDSLGLHDIVGNVSEMCYDCDNLIAPGIYKNPRMEIFDDRLTAGGNYFTGIESVCHREPFAWNKYNWYTGFRLCRSYIPEN